MNDVLNISTRPQMTKTLAQYTHITSYQAETLHIIQFSFSYIFKRIFAIIITVYSTLQNEEMLLLCYFIFKTRGWKKIWIQIYYKCKMMMLNALSLTQLPHSLTFIIINLISTFFACLSYLQFLRIIEEHFWHLIHQINVILNFYDKGF